MSAPKSGASETRHQAGGSTWSRNMCRPKGLMKGQKQRCRPRIGSSFVLHRTGRTCGTDSTGSSGKRKKNREDVLLQADSERVLSPNKSATLLAEIFFPDDWVDIDDPHYAEVRRQTDGDDQPPITSGDLPGIYPTFTGAEVKNAFKVFHVRKAPGIDEITLDIC
ncbi:hypothetical protein EVAR_86047_1 [Eumeta japonica]|uniref:Uncharacterized protein n=1 Tax=Eumeta variegata TaxID=151549 RepID=A0A4C1UKY4_EUMVA|nr:hypothetical protein EVAR_86047_1 [Eumeta japonica]